MIWRTLQMSASCQFLGTRWTFLTLATISQMDSGWWDEKNNCLWTLCLLNEPHWQMISWRNNFLLLIVQTIKIPQKKVRHISYVFMCLKHISSSISHVSSSCGCSDNCLLTQWDKLCKAPPPHMPPLCNALWHASFAEQPLNTTRYNSQNI